MRRLHTRTTLLSCLALLAGSLTVVAPSVAYACGFGSSIGGGNPTVSTDNAHTPTPSAATLYGSISNLGSSQCRGFLTSPTNTLTSWSVPADWNNANNKIEVIGAGASGTAGSNGGAGGTGGAGGGGGGYSGVVNQTLSGSADYYVGVYNGTSIDDTYFCKDTSRNCTDVGDGCVNGYGTSVIAGADGAESQLGGSGCFGTYYAGGGGGTGGSGTAGGGGGGAAGPNGNGGAGSGATGGTGDNGTTAAGANGTEWDSTHGSGGGGAGGSRAAGSNGGCYGAAGGGGQGSGNAGGTGCQGIIVITYTPSGGVTEHGFAYSTESTLSTGVSTTTLGSASATGQFTDSITGLSADTTYYYRAYASNGTATSTGAILSFYTGDLTPARHMRLFEGFRIKLVSGRLKLF